MPASYGPQANPGSYVPSTNIWDVSRVYSVPNLDESLRDLLVSMYQNLNLMSVNLNIKDTGYYVREEFVNGQGWFQNPSTLNTTVVNPELRQVFRKVINFGALPNAAAKTVAHGLTITSTFSFTRIYACASKQTAAFSYIPIPYASVVAVANNIEISVDATNVTITTAIDYSAYTVCYAIIEYIKE